MCINIRVNGCRIGKALEVSIRVHWVSNRVNVVTHIHVLRLGSMLDIFFS